MRRTPMILGIGLLAAAAVLKFAVLPSQAKFPDDVDATSVYEGTMATLFNTEALAAGDLANLFIRDLPVTIENHTKVTAVEGDLALVETSGVATAPDGSVVQTSDGLYAIDRVSMLTVPSFPGADVPTRGEGLVTGFPIGTEARDYTGWSDEIGDTVTLAYQDTERRGGIDTMRFTSTITNQIVVDEDTLALVPPALPKAVVVALASQLDLPAALAGQLDQLIPVLPDPVPLGLVYSAETTLWVEPATGVVIDVERTEKRAAYLDVDVIPIIVPVVDVWDWSYVSSDTTVADAVTTAEDAAGSLSLYGTTLPLVLGLLGLGGLAYAARGRRAAALVEDQAKLAA